VVHFPVKLLVDQYFLGKRVQHEDPWNTEWGNKCM